MPNIENNTHAPAPKLSCPHCDGELLDIMPGAYEDDEPYFAVVCLDCGSEGPQGSTPEEACRLWDAKHTRHRIGRPEPVAAPAASMAAESAAAPVVETRRDRIKREMRDPRRRIFAPGA